MTSDVRQVIEIAMRCLQSGRFDDAARHVEASLALRSHDADLLQMLGIVRLSQQRSEDAIDALNRALATGRPSYALLSNLGKAYALAKLPERALECFRKAIAIAPDTAEAHANLGNTLFLLERFDEALRSYDRALAFKPTLASAHYNAGTVLKTLGDAGRAEQAYLRALALQPNHVAAHSNLGTVYESQGRLDAAVASYAKAMALAPQDADAAFNLANALALLRKLEEAVEVCRKGLAEQPQHPQLLSLVVHTLRRMCAWNGENFEHALVEAARRPDFKGEPFTILSIADDPALQLSAARSYAVNSLPHAPRPVFPKRRGAKLRIGYCSADFGEHVTSYVCAAMMEQHDRARFEIVGVSFGPDGESSMRRRIERSCDEFLDLRGLSDRAAVEKIRALALDVAVDFNGYTRNNRAAIFAHGIAPVQVNYIAFPCTTGAAHIHFIFADRFVIPVEAAVHYAERVVHLPDCYVPTDTYAADLETPPRAQVGLPKEAFVFASFNNNYKIVPAVFDVWMNLLRACPGSVLWLLRDNDWVEPNLRAEAKRRNIDPARIVFAPRQQRSEHLVRHRLADLALDTFPYNGHTTTSDALWMGLPLVTYAGASFASRVAGSMLRAVGLGELITASLSDYQALALRLAKDPSALRDVRTRLVAAVPRSALFDTRAKTRQLERAFEAIAGMRDGAAVMPAITIAPG